MNTKRNPSDRRGFDLDDYPATFQVVLVKASVDAVCEVLGSDRPGQRSDEDSQEVVVFQFQGHCWTLFVNPNSGRDFSRRKELARELSKQLATRAVIFEYESVSGWLKSRGES